MTRDHLYDLHHGHTTARSKSFKRCRPVWHHHRPLPVKRTWSLCPFWPCPGPSSLMIYYSAVHKQITRTVCKHNEKDNQSKVSASTSLQHLRPSYENCTNDRWQIPPSVIFSQYYLNNDWKMKCNSWKHNKDNIWNILQNNLTELLGLVQKLCHIIMDEKVQLTVPVLKAQT